MPHTQEDLETEPNLTRSMKDDGNFYFEFNNVALLAIEIDEAPIVVTSQEIDGMLQETYDRTGIRPGMLENLAGIKQRRWWPDGFSFTDAAREAGEKAIVSSGIDRANIGLLIDTSVCREHLEPSAAVKIHHELSLATSCLNFDLSNACLGFVNGMHLAGTLIDSGQIDYALIVDGEGSRGVQEETILRLQGPETTAQNLMDNFATLTLGSGGAAAVLGRASTHPGGHRVVRGISRAATEHHNLCVGDLNGMRTDARALMEAGVEVSRDAWTAASEKFDWNSMQHYVMHQVSNVHTQAIAQALGLDTNLIPLTFPEYGNIGPASVPTTLSLHAKNITQGDRVGLLGIGSGLNASALEMVW